jgi:hypothetical protein
MDHLMQSVADFHCKNHGGVQLEQRHILSIPSQVSPLAGGPGGAIGLTGPGPGSKGGGQNLSSWPPGGAQHHRMPR